MAAWVFALFSLISDDLFGFSSRVFHRLIYRAEFAKIKTELIGRRFLLWHIALRLSAKD